MDDPLQCWAEALTDRVGAIRLDLGYAFLTGSF